MGRSSTGDGATQAEGEESASRAVAVAGRHAAQLRALVPQPCKAAPLLHTCTKPTACKCAAAQSRCHTPAHPLTPTKPSIPHAHLEALQALLLVRGHKQEAAAGAGATAHSAPQLVQLSEAKPAGRRRGMRACQQQGVPRWCPGTSAQL